MPERGILPSLLGPLSADLKYPVGREPASDPLGFSADERELLQHFRAGKCAEMLFAWKSKCEFQFWQNHKSGVGRVADLQYQSAEAERRLRDVRKSVLKF